MEERHRNSINTVFECVAPYIHDTTDRNSFSLVCRKCYELEGKTRKHVTVHMCYATTPLRFRQRFPFIESLTLKGKPLGYKPSPIHNGYIISWVQEITTSFNLLKAVHFHHLSVSDSDLKLLAITRGKKLTTLNIDSCSGFSTNGLLHIGMYCNNLRSLSVQKSWIIYEIDGKWLHELALRNTSIESLNFYNTRLLKYDVKDLALIAKNCSESLVSVKINKEYDLIDLVDFFNYAINLEDFKGGSFSIPFDARPNKDTPFKFPSKMKQLAMNCRNQTEIRIVEPFAHLFTELDLRYVTSDRVTLNNRVDPCFVVMKCPNLEVLYTMDGIGDRGLQLISHYCKKMRQLYSNYGTEVNGFVSHMGLIDLAQGCLELECLHIYLTSITNEAMSYIGIHLKNLYDFKMILIGKNWSETNFPLDNGVRALLIGCNKLERLSICFEQYGGLTDVGLEYIGKYGRNLRYLSLGYTGESDAGLVELSCGCPNLRDLVMKNCPFSKEAIDIFMCNVCSLRYYSLEGIAHDCRKFRTNLVKQEEDMLMMQLRIS